MDAHQLQTVGTVSNDSENDDSGSYKVTCPRCGYERDGLTRHKACSLSRREGCPDCDMPRNDRYDLTTKTTTRDEALTNVSNPLAVSEE